MKLNEIEWNWIEWNWIKLNKIEFKRLSRDTVIELSTYSIGNYKTGSKPYEGHYVHSETEIVEDNKRVRLYAGDYIIPTDQDAIRYIVETLEPNAPDSWFSWGFFDSILQQKEWFSAYVFDDMATIILANNPELKSRFDVKKLTEPDFAKSSFEQLYFIYKNSEWFEDLNRYPVYKWFGGSKIDIESICKWLYFKYLIAQFARPLFFTIIELGINLILSQLFLTFAPPKLGELGIIEV